MVVVPLRNRKSLLLRNPVSIELQDVVGDLAGAERGSTLWGCYMLRVMIYKCHYEKCVSISVWDFEGWGLGLFRRLEVYGWLSKLWYLFGFLL